MAVKCKNRHYEIERITTRHWRCLADLSGVPFDAMEALVHAVPAAIDRVADNLPRGFPEHVWRAIADGVRHNADRFTAGVSAGPG